MSDVLDYCAGIGGWAIALHRRGLAEAGVENAPHPLLARHRNGLTTVWQDMTTLPRALQARGLWAGVVGSLPCQPYSQNIKGRTWEQVLADPRAALFAHGSEQVTRMAPPFVCLENVHKSTPLMQALGHRLERRGYSWDVRTINAADYGLPQARKRALLVARADGQPITWPEPTHIGVKEADGFHATLKPHVSLVEGLGLEPFPEDDPRAWANTTPAPAVVGSFSPEMHAPPRYRGYGDVSRQNDPGAVSLTLEQRLVLQGFPTWWALAGPKTAMDLQVGNAIPPVLAEVALDAAGVTP